MSIQSELLERSNGQCELCTATENLKVFEVSVDSDGSAGQAVLLCGNCCEQIEDPDKMDINHWRCLNDSMWSQLAPVQVLAWRMLTRLAAEGWPQDLLDMLDLDDATLAWAKQDMNAQADDAGVVHKDANGALLLAGDSVTLVKDLVVKGAGFTAKRGTAVRGISLVVDNSEHIEGRVNGQQIVILTKFVKKSG